MTDTPQDPARRPEPTPSNEEQVPQQPAAPDSGAATPQSTPTEPVAGEQTTAEYPTTPVAPQTPQPAAPETNAAQVASADAQPTEPIPPQGTLNPYLPPPTPAQQVPVPTVEPTAPMPGGAPTMPAAQDPSAFGPAATTPQPHPGYAAQPGAYAGQQPGQPYLAQPGQEGQPAGSAAPQTAVADGTTGSGTGAKKESRNRVGLLITGFVLAGLLGGGVGAGVVGVYAANNDNLKPVSSTGATSVTVNNPSTATDVTAVASQASPSVVTINVTGSSEAGTGSGVILSSDGYIVTNTHVVTLDGETASPTITVTTNDGKIYKASVVGTDPVLDLAVVKLQNASGLKVATFADSDKLNVGDTAIAIGAPLGLSGTVTNGVVSALNRSIQIASSAAPSQDQQDNGDNGSNPFNFWNFDQNGGSGSGSTTTESTISLPVIQTDAAINPGNSGGALLNAKGQIIGINVAIASASSSSSDSSGQSGSIGVGFAIPSNVAERVANDIISSGKATSGLLGATVADADSASNATNVGALIKSVTSGGAAAGAGLAAGDVVTNFNGKPITNATDLTAQVRALAGGSKATIVFVRDGANKSTSVTLGTLSQ